MKIFVSYSFEHSWVADYVVPLIRHFGHEPVTGQMLDAGALPDEVKAKMRLCRRVVCFATRATPIYTQGASEPSSYAPPAWVRDELMMARGRDQLVTEFRESKVDYGGGAEPFHSHIPFDQDQLPKLLLALAEQMATWPVGPIELVLSCPEHLKEPILAAANAGTLRATCTATEDDVVVDTADLLVRPRGDQLVVLFWIKPRPNYSIDVVVPFGTVNLARRGISPVIREAALKPV